MARRGPRPVSSSVPGSWPVAATFIGTVVGAGFASGQEILSFFTLYGWAGTLGIVLATAGFAVGGRWWLEVGARTRAGSYRDALQTLAGPWAGSLFDGLLAAALFAGTGIMTAGAAAVTEEQLGWPAWAGRVVFLALCTATVWRGLPGVLAANVAVVPLLTGAVLVVSARALATAGLPPAPAPVPGPPGWLPAPGTEPRPAGPEAGWLPPPTGPALPSPGPVPGLPPADPDPGLAPAAPVPGLPPAAAGHWLLAALLYVGFNLLLSLPVLVPLGAVAPPRARRGGGLAGAAGLGALALLLHLALLARMPAVATREVPVLELARGLDPRFVLALAATLWTEIYTTAVGSLYGFASRLGPPGSAAYRLALLAAAGAALGIAGTGFARLVRAIYPLMGWIGLALILWLLAAPPPGGAPSGAGKAPRGGAAAAPGAARPGRGAAPGPPA